MVTFRSQKSRRVYSLRCTIRFSFVTIIRFEFSVWNHLVKDLKDLNMLNVPQGQTKDKILEYTKV